MLHAVHCPHCDASFDVKKSLRGAPINCPSCRKLMTVPRGVTVGRVLLIALVLFVLGVSVYAYFTVGVVPAVLTFVFLGGPGVVLLLAGELS